MQIFFSLSQVFNLYLCMFQLYCCISIICSVASSNSAFDQKSGLSCCSPPAEDAPVQRFLSEVHAEHVFVSLNSSFCFNVIIKSCFWILLSWLQNFWNYNWWYRHCSFNHLIGFIYSFKCVWSPKKTKAYPCFQSQTLIYLTLHNGR